MKKTIIIILLILSIYFFIGYKFSSIDIPENALRIRILANSNSNYDQIVKNNVKNEIQDYVYNLLKNTKDINEARQIIYSNLNSISTITGNNLKNQNYNLPFEVKFGFNYFPKKEYKGVKYNEGYYESLLITLGSGKGDNWWCILFPPLCLLEAEENKKIEYTTLVSEIIKKYKY